MEWLGENEIPFAIIFTKIDKLSKSRVKENLAKYTDKLQETWDELPPIFITSSEHRIGGEEILDYIDKINKELKHKK